MSRNDDGFDAAKEVEKLKEQTKAIRKRTYFRRISMLEKHKAKIISMYEEGATQAEIMRWLNKKGIYCAKSTLSRYLNKHF